MKRVARTASAGRSDGLRRLAAAYQTASCCSITPSPSDSSTPSSEPRKHPDRPLAVRGRVVDPLDEVPGQRPAVRRAAHPRRPMPAGVPPLVPGRFVVHAMPVEIPAPSRRLDRSPDRRPRALAGPAPARAAGADRRLVRATEARRNPPADATTAGHDRGGVTARGRGATGQPHRAESAFRSCGWDRAG